MRVSILVPDNTVYVDGVPAPVDCTELASDTHAVQWYDDYGEVEYVTTIDPEAMMLHKEPNGMITDFTPYQPYVEEWVLSHNRKVEERKKIEDEMRETAEKFAEMQRAQKEADEKAAEEAANRPTPIDIVFEHENRIRRLEGRREITLEELTKYVWERIEPCE
jgi:hypothetical protein